LGGGYNRASVGGGWPWGGEASTSTCQQLIPGFVVLALGR